MAAITSSCPVLMKVPELRAGAEQGWPGEVEKQRECQQVRKREQSLSEGQSCRQGSGLCLRHIYHALMYPKEARETDPRRTLGMEGRRLRPAMHKPQTDLASLPHNTHPCAWHESNHKRLHTPPASAPYLVLMSSSTDLPSGATTLLRASWGLAT